MAYTVPNPNVLLILNEDKLGHILIELKTQLVATGLFRVKGSGDGQAKVELEGQTAGVAGSFDVFTATQPWLPVVRYNENPWWGLGGPGTISRAAAWYILEEISSGRLFAFQRNTNPSVDSPGSFYIKITTQGCASSGATATAMPALLGAVGSWNSNITYCNGYNDTTSGYPMWLQIGRSDQVDGSGGVCPFWLSVWNRKTNTPLWGMIYESLDDVPVGSPPFVVGADTWGAGSGPFWSFYGANLYAPVGAAWPAHRLSALYVNGAARPSNTVTDQQPLGPDGKWRAFHPPVSDATGKWGGRCRNILSHPINRDYPTTYDVLSDTPRAVLGQILVPWAKNVSPESSP